MTSQEIIPSPRRLMESLRGMEYSFPSAVADLVDNAIEAQAMEISVKVISDGENSRVLIADNGKGIPSDKMREVMRYGTERKYGDSDLGRFGLGLKTASMSQCRRVEIFSRTSLKRSVLYGLAWDLDRVKKRNRWEVEKIPSVKIDSEVHDFLKKSPGTVVIWRKLDRIFDLKNPNGKWAENSIYSLCRELEKHLAMVFHRFIDGDENHHIKFLLNDNRIEAWDPFVRDEQETRQLEPVHISLGDGKIRLEPFILPPRDDFSLPSKFDRASGPAKWNQQQGFYIYRAGRMIQSGGWCRLRARDEHTKLARIALHFSPSQDSAFRIDVSKMSVTLPPEIRDQILQKIKPVVSEAQSVYRKKGKSNRKAHERKVSKQNDRKLMWNEVQHGEERVIADKMPQRWTLDELESKFRKLAYQDELPVLERILERVRKLAGR